MRGHLVDGLSLCLSQRYNLVNASVSRWDSAQEHHDEESAICQAPNRTWTSIFRQEPTGSFIDMPSSNEKNLDEPQTTGNNQYLIDFKKGCEFWSWMFVWSRFSYLGVGRVQEITQRGNIGVIN